VFDTLLNLTTKAASALENARLYSELAERERQLQELVGRLLFSQEEERRRIAYEVHDGPTQVAVGAYQRLQAFACMYPPDTAEGRKALDEAVELTRRTVEESREVIANFRPTVLDDFGLATAVRLHVEGLRTKGWRISYEENLSKARIPSPVEAVLYRVAQEALANVLKHARTTRIRLKLRRSRKGVRLLIRDWGVGFKPDSSQTGGPGERVGLAGMRERVALVGGKLRIYSKEGTGSLIIADVPLAEVAADRDIDLAHRLAFTGHPSAEDSNA
jgi:signal transduction histidine kinase